MCYSSLAWMLRPGPSLDVVLNEEVYTMWMRWCNKVKLCLLADHPIITFGFGFGIDVWFKWVLQKKATQVLYLHIALKKQIIVDDFHEKQEQVKEWLQNLGILDHAAVMHDDDDFEDDVRFHRDGSSRHHNIPSRAAFSIITPSIGRQQSMADNAKIAMQGYLNHFLGSLDIVNSRQVCKFLEVSKLSFLQEYGPKLKEDYVLVKHLVRTPRKDAARKCWPCRLFGCCRWQKVWAVLKPGFLAFLEDPLDVKLMDIIIFDFLPSSNSEKVYLAHETKSHKPLQYAFKISCGNWNLTMRTSSSSKVKDWIAAINDAVQKPSEGWCHPHRFGSFAPPRKWVDGSEAQWFIDGESAFDAIAAAIENANTEIFITGWWLCPELYLRRPFTNHKTSRLDILLESKAKEGVHIYILLYKEVSIALKINSIYSKRRLLDIHENVRVLRYPDHMSTGIYYWSHHEKIVVVDNQICFIGGLDLCFGRYDTVDHKVGDLPPLNWPGKDYYNPRESEPNSWEDMMKDELDRQRYPRMPWHDVQCALWGPPCRDIARHFVQRWNYAKKSKAPHQRTIPLLIPRHHMVLPHYVRSTEINVPNNEEKQRGNVKNGDLYTPESPELDVPLLLPQDSEALDTSKCNDTLQSNRSSLDRTSRDYESSSNFQNVKAESLAQHTQIHEIVDQVQYDNIFDHIFPSSNQNSVDWWEAQEQDEVKYTSEPLQIGPRTFCHCQIIRSVSQWSAGTSQDEDSIHRAYCALIEQAEHFIYIENQFFISGLEEDAIIRNRVMEALRRRILLAHKQKKCLRVIIVIPLLPGFQGRMDDAGAATVRALMHWQYRTICRGDDSILCKLKEELGSQTDDYISFYGLRTYGRLYDGGPLVTSQVYVHSKVMIIDDRIALVGSSNINDRSLLGSRDSEIGVVIEDKEFLESSMNGQLWMAGKFSSSLRLSLWAEHLGLSAGEINQIRDPVADSTYKSLWMETAKANTIVYETVFGCTPNDQIHSKYALFFLSSPPLKKLWTCNLKYSFLNAPIWCHNPLYRNAFRQKMSQLTENLEYTTIDFGVAPQVVKFYEDGLLRTSDPSEMLKSVKGHIVCFPLDFMKDEDLRPMFHEGEFYTSPEVFH
ncbi:phospholipase D zeta 1-like isoform X2 [Amaranthus tricolor]|uniref:phospholipase D zeta 1-like isoform X2 n=2 Tax=Amaranthus tricolor TaxID=29722 RepID=UPI00258EE1A5|nr:phospholipase D zeta 1-like isoform X2 [Amaranthus tricolor]